MGAGEYQADALQNLTGEIAIGKDYWTNTWGATGVFAATGNTTIATASSSGTAGAYKINLDASRMARTSSETRGAATRVPPVVLV